MSLRRGKTKYLLSKSKESALMAVETYNSPRKQFRAETYIVLMIIALTKLFHAYFNRKIGNKYYYKIPNGRYLRVDGQKKSWELKTCIKKYRNLDDSVNSNFDFFIKLRNRIEHSSVEQEELNYLIFGECQALLFNYETLLITFFGTEYQLNESLAFSLQFSLLRSSEQRKASKRLLASEMTNIRKFIDDYRSSLSDDIFNSQEFSIKLIQIPKVSNTNRRDVAIEFVKWSQLSNEDKENYERLLAIIKPKVVKQDVANGNKYSSGQVVTKVNTLVDSKFKQYDHLCLYYIFSIHPYGHEKEFMENYDTNTEYCLFDDAHNDFVFYEKWIDFIVNLLNNNLLTQEEWRRYKREERKLSIEDYR